MGISNINEYDARLFRWQSKGPIRHPDPVVTVLDPRFQHLVLGMAAIERISTGFRFTDGPAYFGDARRVQSDGRWQDIDVFGWQNEVDGRMPRDLTAQRSYHLDLANLQATSAVARPQDTRCWATGGIVIVELAIRGEQLVVDRVEVRPMP